MEVRKDLATRVSLQIDAYNASISGDGDNGDMATKDRWERADDVYHESLILSSLSMDKDSMPYHVSLLPQRVDGIVSTVCGNITSADPYFLFKSPAQDVEALEGLQQTVTYALQNARFDHKIRKASQEAVLKGKAWMRVRYSTTNTDLLADMEDVDLMQVTPGPNPEGSEMGEVQVTKNQNPKEGAPKVEVRYSGLVIDVFKPEDAVCYPTWANNPMEMTLIGHRFTQRHQDIITKQEQGRYFQDAVISLSNDGDNAAQSVIQNPNDYGQLCYDVLIKCKPGSEDVPVSNQPESWYRATILYNNRELLALEPYDLPTPWYFAPTLKGDIDRFWPRRSITDRLIEPQTLYNDAWTLIVLGTAATAITHCAVTGWSGAAETTVLDGMRKLIAFKTMPTITPLPGTFNPAGVTWIIENLERVADSISRFSQVGLGAEQAPNTTATATNATVMGQQAGSEDYTREFGLELERMADLVRSLLFINWDAFYEFNEGALTLQKPDDLIMRCQIEINGVRPADTPDAQMTKLETMLKAFQMLGIQPIPSTQAINIDALAQLVLNTLNMQSSTAKILQEQPQNGIDPNNPQGAPGSVPPGVPGGSQNGLPDPEVLRGLAQQLQSQMAPQQMANGAPGMSGGAGPSPAGPMAGPG